MTINLRSWVATILTSVVSFAAFSQNIELSGVVTNNVTGEPVPSVSVLIAGSNAGTYSDERGNFRITTSRTLPLTLVFSSVGYESQQLTVTSLAVGQIRVRLSPSSALGTQVVVSASRVPERMLESPVSIERINASDIRMTPVVGYYDMLRNVKGVDLVYSSLTFATPSTRGFNGSGNARLNQLVDGMDNQAPGLNFSVGSVVGLTELDVESMELLPGASSVLYGPGGMNGTLLINSKDPFKYQGLSMQVKTGIMHVDRKQRDQPSAYHDWSLRWGKKVNERFAFKIGAQFIHAKDWIATDRTNYQAGDVTRNEYGNVKGGDRQTDPNYDGVNVYGDETTLNLSDPAQPALALVSGAIKQELQTQLPQPLYDAAAAYLDSTVGSYGRFDVSRTGYEERDVINNNTVNFKFSGGLYYKINENLEASLVGFWGTGNTVYTGSDRYSFRNLKVGQYKLELKHRDWLVRAYTTQENAGDSYNATITTRLFNEGWKESSMWYPEYAQGFLTSKVTPYVEALAGGTSFTPTADATAHSIARAFADQGRPMPGTPQFNTIFDAVRATPVSEGGGLLLDRSDLYYVEGQYNFGDRLKFADLLIGGSFRQFVLNSQGTLFADTAGTIKINEIGGYAQLSRSFFGESLKLTAAGRYDKNENFDGRFTPRFTAVVKVAEDHNIRASYQTAYRFPTTQNQWINLVIGGGTVLLGGLPDLRDFYNFNGNKTYTISSVGAAGAALQTGASPEEALALLEEAIFTEYKPETLRSFEVGYKTLINKRLLIDAYGYVGRYENFLGRKVVLQAVVPGDPFLLFSSATRRAVSVAVNSAGKVSTYGFGASVDYLFPRNYMITANISADRITDVEPGFVSFFNTPSYRLILGLGNSGFGPQKRFGFSVNIRKQDGYFYESDFRQGYISGFTNVDAQVSRKFPKQRTLLKIGGTNIFNRYYQTGFGNPGVGGLYYVSLGYNVY